MESEITYIIADLDNIYNTDFDIDEVYEYNVDEFKIALLMFLKYFVLNNNYELQSI